MISTIAMTTMLAMAETPPRPVPTPAPPPMIRTVPPPILYAPPRPPLRRPLRHPHRRPPYRLQRARAKANLGSLISEEDYPAAAIRNREEGVTDFRLIVGPNGRVSNCSIVRSSGYVSLDSATCRLHDLAGALHPGAQLVRQCGHGQRQGPDRLAAGQRSRPALGAGFVRRGDALDRGRRGDLLAGLASRGALGRNLPGRRVGPAGGESALRRQAAYPVDRHLADAPGHGRGGRPGRAAAPCSCRPKRSSRSAPTANCSPAARFEANMSDATARRASRPGPASAGTSATGSICRWREQPGRERSISRSAAMSARPPPRLRPPRRRRRRSGLTNTRHPGEGRDLGGPRRDLST